MSIVDEAGNRIPKGLEQVLRERGFDVTLSKKSSQAQSVLVRLDGVSEFWSGESQSKSRIIDND
jgi:hypothetical protein